MWVFQEVVERLFLTDISEKSLVSSFSKSDRLLKEFLRVLILFSVHTDDVSTTSSDPSVSISFSLF